MKFFIDTANIDEIRDADDLGILDGVTTNPSLIAREKKPFEELLREICSIVDGPVSAEVTATDHKNMVIEGKRLSEIHPNITIKLPLTRDGLKSCVSLHQQNIPVNMTLCFSPAQALMAAKAGATFVSPFVGRLDDISHFGMDLVRQIVTIYENYDYITEVLVASVRHPIHILEAGLAGAGVVTIPHAVIDKLLKHPLTDIGLEKFMADWNKTGQKI